MPLADDQRLRGHTSLHGGTDGQLLVERKETAPLMTVMSLKKLKDEEDETQFDAHLQRIVIGCDSDDEEISTLAVSCVEAATTVAGPTITGKKKPAPKPPPADRSDSARDRRGRTGHPIVSRRTDRQSRRRRGGPDSLLARMAEKAGPDENPHTILERQRKAYFRAVRAALAAKELNARIEGDERFLWLPQR